MGGKWVETRREECGWDGEIIGSFVKNGNKCGKDIGRIFIINLGENKLL